MTFNQLHNSSVITVVVHFIGDVHQITKLFPQKIMGGIGYPMDILISLKAPLESLGKPRILLGLMYSNSQEMQVDARHYKETGKGEAGRGFLHVDFHQGKDLPQQKGKILESLAKCYLLPNCKKAKCKSGFKKGKNPLWDEQFLIVGVGYLEVKKQVLEICFVNNNQKKKNKFFGGLRLSLGYSKIMAAQAEKTSKVISHLFSKPLKIENDDNTSKDRKSNGSEYKTVARFAIAVEKKEKNALHEAQINGSVSAEDRDLVNTPIVNPDVNTKKTWKVTSSEELQRLDMINYKYSNERLSLSDGDVKLRGNGIMTVGSYNTPQVIPPHGSSSNKEFTPVNILQPEYAIIRKPSFDGELWTKQKDQTSSRDKIMRRNSESQEQGKHQNQEISKENGLGANGNNTKLHFLQSNGNVNQSRTFENQNEMAGTEDIRNFKSEQKQEENSRTLQSNSDCNKAIVKSAETSGCSASLAQRWNRTATERQFQKEQKKEATKNHLEKALGDELENMMLDAVGLEIKQWENMINKPKQWHYCWQILRKDMIPVHNCST